MLHLRLLDPTLPAAHSFGLLDRSGRPGDDGGAGCEPLPVSAAVGRIDKVPSPVSVRKLARPIAALRSGRSTTCCHNKGPSTCSHTLAGRPKISSIPRSAWCRRSDCADPRPRIPPRPGSSSRRRRLRDLDDRAAPIGMTTERDPCATTSPNSLGRHPYSAIASPDPPNSVGKSFSLGRPSCIGRTVDS